MRRKKRQGAHRLSRRTFLKQATAVSIGMLGMQEGATIANGAQLVASAGHSAVQTGLQADASHPPPHGAPLRGLDLPRKARVREGRFGLMFKQLPAFAPPDELLNALGRTMREVGEEVSHAENDRLNDNPNPDLHAGFTFLAQFIDHDLTFDTTPLTEQQADPDAVTNFRSARYDLDSLYGRGPEGDPQFYDPRDLTKFLIVQRRDGATSVDDVPRRSDGTAIIADPRNDQHLIIIQLHLAFMKFHNQLVKHVRARGVPPAEVFAEARRLARWHFQWIVLHEFLPHLVGHDILAAIVEEREAEPAKVRLAFYKPQNPHKPMLPVEFAVAAYRFGHSLVRPRYTINATASAIPFFGADPSQLHLNGSRPIPPELVLQWSRLFPLDPAVTPRRARRIDTRLSTALFNLPTSVVPPPDPETMLAVRNLLRGKRLGLPSGQQVAKHMGLPVLANEQLGLGSELGWQGEAPLWFYVLKEAELQQQSARLGAVGGRIVAEVLVGLLDRDQHSYLRQAPGFKPVPPIAPTVGVFTMSDLLRFAGMAAPPPVDGAEPRVFLPLVQHE